MNDVPHRFLNEIFSDNDLQLQLERHSLNQSFKLHWHEFYELTFVISGSGTNRINGRPVPICPGMAFLLTPADFHEIEVSSASKLEVYNLIFSQGMMSDAVSSLIFDDGLLLSRYAFFRECSAKSLIDFRFDSLWHELNNLFVGRKFALLSELNLLLIDWHRHRISCGIEDKPESFKSSIHPGVQKALVYIQHHYRQPLTLEDAAKVAHLSVNYFSELFSRTTGITFQRYLQIQRLQFAMSLLKVSTMPITEISYGSGFNTLTHFERAFRNHFGLTPSQVKKKITN